jgi:uncharacterized protein (UPF0261 family)
MAKTAAIIAALDTKAAEALFVAEIIRKRGHRTLIIDVGVLADPLTEPDISSAEVARAAGVDLAGLRSAQDKGSAMAAMTLGAARIVTQLYAAHAFDGLVGLGGTAGTTIAANAAQALPVGVPKLLVSTVASGDTRTFVGTKDVTMMYSVVDIAGLNRISTKVLTNAAGAIAGMLEVEQIATSSRPVIAASMFGNTTRCVDYARAELERTGYEVLVFHATGTGGMTMESLISDGLIDGVLDITTTEWADELCGGVFSAGPHRLEAAAHSGVPQVVVPGCLDMVNFWGPDSVPARYAGRTLFRWNPSVTLMRTNVEENERLGQVLATRVSQSRGPAAVLLPLRGISQLDSAGKEFWWPEADQALFAAIRRHIRADIPVIDVDAHINDSGFAARAVATLLGLIGSHPRPRKDT